MTVAEDARDAIAERLLGSPVARRLGIELLSVEAGRVQLRLPFEPGNVTAGTMVHGGVIATLVDVAGVAGAVSAAPTVPEGGATSDLSISFLRPAVGEDLVAIATVLRAGRTRYVTRVEVVDERGRQVVEATVNVTLTG